MPGSEDDLSFSQRMGLTPTKKSVQLKSMDGELRISLWNLVFPILNKLDDEYDTWRRVLLIPIYEDFLYKSLDEQPEYPSHFRNELKQLFLRYDWNRVYDLIEFISNIRQIKKDTFITNCNSVLETHNSGYRFVGSKISPVTNPEEIAEIETAIETSKLAGIGGASVHLEKALQMLSDRQSPDYRNSIKESISAVECVANVICEREKATLGEALKQLQGQIEIHPALQKGFSSIYGYTSDAGGIRHALMEPESTPALEDARYMLIACSAFVNYLIEKANKAGILPRS